MRNHIIFFSGGKSSFTVADWVKEHYPEDNIVLYFTDTEWEDEDLYRFIYEGSDALKLPLLYHSAGLNPIELMFEQKLVFNSRLGECSKKLKMGVARDFLKKGKKPKKEKWHNKEYLKSEDFRDPENTTLYFGIGWDEAHREGPIRKNWKPYNVGMPLMDEIIDNGEILKKHGLRQPRLYDYGFTHNNCKGRCVKAGQGHYKHLKESMPDVFQEVLEQEHHMKNYVSAWRYIKNMDTDDNFSEEAKEMMLKECDDAYRAYFYGEAKRPELFIHPAASSANMSMKEYAFMKKQRKGVTKPYSIRNMNLELEDEKKQESIDLFDIGGCGCFIEFDENEEAEV